MATKDKISKVKKPSPKNDTSKPDGIRGIKKKPKGK